MDIVQKSNICLPLKMAMSPAFLTFILLIYNPFLQQSNHHDC